MQSNLNCYEPEDKKPNLRKSFGTHNKYAAKILVIFMVTLSKLSLAVDGLGWYSYGNWGGWMKPETKKIVSKHTQSTGGD